MSKKVLYRPLKDYPSYRKKLLDDFRRSRQRPNTTKQDDWVAETKETGDPIASALKVYATDSPSAAKQIVKYNMKKPAIRDELEDLYEETGCETRTALEVIGDGMKANKEGHKDGDDFIEGGPDHRIRLDSAKELLKLRDAYPKGDISQHEHRHLHAIVVKEFSQHSSEELANMIEAEVFSASRSEDTMTAARSADQQE